MTLSRASRPPSTLKFIPSTVDTARDETARQELHALWDRHKRLIKLKTELEDKLDFAESTLRKIKAKHQESLKELWDYIDTLQRIVDNAELCLSKAVQASYPAGVRVLVEWCNGCSHKNGKLPIWKFPPRIFKRSGERIGFGFAPYCVECKNKRQQRSRAKVKRGAKQSDNKAVRELATAIVERGPNQLVNAIAEDNTPEGGEA